MTIRDFEETIDRVILGRGYDYYEHEHISEMYQEADGTYVFEVEGAEEYQVDVKLDENEKIIHSYCTCPFNYGPECKHEVAAYYKLREYLDSEKRGQRITTKQNIEEVLNTLTKQQLIVLLLPSIKKDKVLKKKVLLQYGEVNVAQELKQMERRVQSLVNDYVQEGNYIDDGREDEFIDKLWALVNYVEPLMGNEKKVLHALDIFMLLLEEIIILNESVEDEAGLIPEIIKDILGRIKKLVAESMQYNEAIKKQIVNKILVKIHSAKLQEWVDYGTQLLQSIVIYGLDEKYRQLLYKELNQQMEIADSDTVEVISLMLFELLQHHGTEQEIEQYIEEHIQMDTFREIFLTNLMEKQQYEKVIQATLEVEEEYKEDGWGIDTSKLDKWKKIRYEAYKALGDTKNQEILAKESLIRGKFEYYEDLKTLHKEDYNSFYSAIKEELKAKTGMWENSTFRKLIEKENDIQEIMEIVRKEPNKLSKYIKCLMDRYSDEVLALYRKYIKDEAEKAYTRERYRAVCYMIVDYRKYESEQRINELIIELKIQHKRRPAFIDELSKIE